MPVEGLILWDVDKTLLDVSGISQQIYAVAFEQVVGRPLDQVADMAGRTEHAILTDTLALNGLSDMGLEVFYDALCAAAEGLQDRMREEGRALPGAHAALAALRRREGLVQSVATGNLRPVAEIKLAAFDMTGDLDLAVGGYGSDGAGVRSELVRLALARTNAKHGVSLSPHQVVVVGDTPLDVEAAHGAGARSVAVATGKFPAAALAEANADVVLPDLTSTDDVETAVLRLLEGQSKPQL